MAHAFWAVAGPVERFHSTSKFLEQAGLIGGLALAAMLSERAGAGQ